MRFFLTVTWADATVGLPADEDDVDKLPPTNATDNAITKAKNNDVSFFILPPKNRTQIVANNVRIGC